MISINATLFIQIIHFLILVFILNRLMLRPILKIIDERRQYIEDTKKEAVRIEEETSDLLNKCLSMEETARRDARNENSNLKQEVIAEAEKVFGDTRDEASLIRDRAKNEIEEKLKEARQFIRQEALVLANDITEKVIGRRIVN